jgi:ssDNA-binding Zn-finger/Zn-ribbon topoisomerase 1
MPDGHTSPSRARGCPICGGSQRLTLSKFRERASRVHNGRYAYPDQQYKDMHTKIVITCNEHGEFLQTPESHLSGRGCPKCADLVISERRRVTENEFNARLLARCQDSGSVVSLVPGSYAGQNKHAVTICSIHGQQAKRLATLLLRSSHPCIECSGYKHLQGYSTPQFRKLLEERFGPDLTVEPFSYHGTKTNITLSCSKKGHGSFTIQAASMYRSPGCPKCSHQGSQPKRNAGLLATNTSRRVLPPAVNT